MARSRSDKKRRSRSTRAGSRGSSQKPDCAFHRCPPPEVLIRDAFNLFLCFKDVMDPERPGCRFFKDNALDIFLKEMKYVQLGLLSDPPGMNMYVRVDKLKTGLIIYRSLRSTSQLEGYHLALRKIIDPNGLHAGLRYKSAAIA